MNLKGNIPWVEKYRPNTIDDILDQNEVTKILKKSIKRNGNIPHMLFYGSSGTGKSSTALALCYQLFVDRVAMIYLTHPDLHCPHMTKEPF